MTPISGCGSNVPDGAAVFSQRAADSRTAGFRSAPRVHQALTAPLEKRVLQWLARHTPAWINSDHLTLLGLAAQLCAGICYALARWNKYALLLINLFIFLNWLGDSLDGTLARVRDQQRPRYGFYVDHIIDSFGAAFLMCGLALSGYLHWQIAWGMLIAFLILSIETYLATYTIGNFHLSHSFFGPTELRILLMAGNFVLLSRPYAHLFGHKFLLFDVGGVVAIAGMLFMAVVATVRHTYQLYREEQLP